LTATLLHLNIGILYVNIGQLQAEVCPIFKCKSSVSEYPNRADCHFKIYINRLPVLCFDRLTQTRICHLRLSRSPILKCNCTVQNPGFNYSNSSSCKQFQEFSAARHQDVTLWEASFATRLSTHSVLSQVRHDLQRQAGKESARTQPHTPAFVIDNAPTAVLNNVATRFAGPKTTL
jgi:hypothetical protein